jgi:hypothetical protein
MAYLNLQAVVSSHSVPVTTLAQTDFIVGNTWGSFRVEVEFFQHVGQVGPGAVNAAGLYMMRLVPIAGSVWAVQPPMHLVFVVDTGRDHGQTVAELLFA